MKKITRIFYTLPIAVAFVLGGCEKDPFEDIVSHERSIEIVTLGGDLVQVGPAVIDRTTGKASVKVLMEEGTDLSNVKINLMSSYKSNASPASGSVLNFEDNNNQQTFTITAESGESREWIVELVPFTEELLGTFDVNGLVVWGGTGPEWGGGAVLNMTDKPWVWPAEDGPAAELDNALTFTYEGVTEDGRTYGKVINDAGADELYANFLFVGDPQTDVNHFYRTIPKGEGTWFHDYSNNTVTFKFSDGTTKTGKFIGASTIDVGYDKTKIVTDNAFEFALNGTDDWNKIYTDYDKFVKRPRTFWIDIKRQ